MLVQNGLVRELRVAGLVSNNTTESRTVMTGMHHLQNENAAHQFGCWYDFSRTASSVLRLFMLEASGMIHLHNPEFTSREVNRQGMNKRPEEPNFNMAHGDAAQAGLRAQLISSDFDRLFPHFVIQQKLNGIEVNQLRTISGMMYVMYFNERTIYQTNVTMDVRLIAENENGLEVEANITVTVTKFSYNEFEINDENRENFERFSLVQQLIKEWDPEGQIDNDVNQVVNEAEELNLGND